MSSGAEGLCTSRSIRRQLLFPEGGDVNLSKPHLAAPGLASITKATIDGVSDIFTQCATSEGLKFEAWSGVPNSGEPLWEGSDYDLEPALIRRTAEERKFDTNGTGSPCPFDSYAELV